VSSKHHFGDTSHHGLAEATSAQLWVSLKYTVNADRRCLEMLGA